VLFNPLQGSLLQYLLHFLIVSFYAEECGAEDEELCGEHEHGAVDDAERRQYQPRSSGRAGRRKSSWVGGCVLSVAFRIF